MLAAVFLLVPCDGVVSETVDIIELNHYLVSSWQGHSEYAHQYIFWEWCEDRFNIVDWRRSNGTPAYRRFGRWWVLRMRNNQCLRKIRARAIRETWTSYDVEVVEREQLYCRRMLRPLVKR